MHLDQYFTDIKLFSNVAAYYQRLTQRPEFIQAMPASDDQQLIFSRAFYDDAGTFQLAFMFLQ